jgi:taurine dioxygenase
MWDDIGTLRNAQDDYRPDQHRPIKLCQVMADRISIPPSSGRQ